MRNIVNLLNHSQIESYEDVEQRPDYKMAASEKIIKKLYYISTSCFIVLTIVMVVASETNKDLFEEMASFIQIGEYIICVILMIIYLCLLVKQIDQINHLNFITEKKVLYNTSITFVLVMAARTVVKLTLIIKPAFLYDHGLFATIISDLVTAFLFEFAPVTIIMIQHLKNRNLNAR